MCITITALLLQSPLTTDLTKDPTSISTKTRLGAVLDLKLPTMLELQIRMHLKAVSSYLFLSSLIRRPRSFVSVKLTIDWNSVLDKARIEYSYKHDSLVSLTIDSVGSGNQDSPGSQEWRLPTYDPHNEKKYLYKLHTIDMYFWTKEDALLFVNAARRVLPEHQLSIRDEPVAPPSHTGDMSPVVQQLENIAISDPSYQNGRTKNSQSSTAFPGPPMSAVPKPEEKPAAAFAPMAYNPAAPAAPEQIRHREKTPPPEDGAANPLMAAAASDQGQPFSPPAHQQSFPGPPSALGPTPSSQGGYFPGPPQQSPYTHPGSVPPPPPVGRTSSMHHTQQTGFTPQYAQQHGSYGAQPGTPGFQQPLQSPGFQQPLKSPGFQQPLQSPGFQQPLQSPGFQPQGFSGPPHSSPPPQQGTPQSFGLPGPPPGGPTPPPGGFSQYQYSQGPGKPLANDYSVHQQVYRPTEAEGQHKYKPQKEPRGKLEDNAMKLEKGVTSIFKKIEKKYL